MSLAIGRLVSRALADILESAHRPRDESAALIAHLALAKGHGRRAMKGMTARGEAAASEPRLHEARLHLDRDAATGARVERATGNGHRDVEQGHDDAAVRDVPAIEVARLQLQRDRRAPCLGREKLNAQIVDERNAGAERGWCSHGGTIIFTAIREPLGRRAAGLRLTWPHHKTTETRGVEAKPGVDARAGVDARPPRL